MSSLSDDSWIELAESNVDTWRDHIFFGIWLALFRVWLLFSASGFMGDTLAAMVNVKTMQIPWGIRVGSTDPE